MMLCIRAPHQDDRRGLCLHQWDRICNLGQEVLSRDRDIIASLGSCGGLWIQPPQSFSQVHTANSLATCSQRFKQHNSTRNEDEFGIEDLDEFLEVRRSMVVGILSERE